MQGNLFSGCVLVGIVQWLAFSQRFDGAASAAAHTDSKVKTGCDDTRITESATSTPRAGSSSILALDAQDVAHWHLGSPSADYTVSLGRV